MKRSPIERKTALKRGRWRNHQGRVERTCQHCGKTFAAWASEVARGWGRFCSRACADKHRPPPTTAARKAFRSGADVCQHPTCPGGRRQRGHHEHHVVYRQAVERAGGALWDPRNAFTLCAVCHGAHHQRSRVVPLTALRDENFEFAFELLGAAAYDYFRRRYAGNDPRLDELLDRDNPTT